MSDIENRSVPGSQRRCFGEDVRSGPKAFFITPLFFPDGSGILVESPPADKYELSGNA